jgi:hypothetical protein
MDADAEIRAEVSALEDEIDAAFGRVGAVAAGEMLIDEYRGNQDAGRMAAAFGGRHWSTLSIEELFAHREGLGGLNGPGFRAYLPAYLAALLVAGQPHAFALLEAVLHALHPLVGDELDVTATRERLSGLDPAQRRVLDDVIRLVDRRRPR